MVRWQAQFNETNKKEIYNQGVEDCCKILANAVNDNYINELAYAVIIANFDQLKR